MDENWKLIDSQQRRESEGRARREGHREMVAEGKRLMKEHG